jgi:endonuclease/exonuclease/phosphatase family metal-dependent hydrolase
LYANPKTWSSRIWTKEREIIQIVQDIDPDVIVGDFNSGKRKTADKSLKLHPIYKDLDPTEKKRFLQYFSGIHDTLANIGFISAYEETDVGTTSVFGGVPDWVYLKKGAFDVHGKPKVLSSVLTDQLSDHAGVIVSIKKNRV